MQLTQGDSSFGLMPVSSLLAREMETEERFRKRRLTLSPVILGTPTPSLRSQFPSAIITATFNESLLHGLHCIKLFTDGILSSQQPGAVDIISPILQLTVMLREFKQLVQGYSVGSGARIRTRSVCLPCS